MRDQDDGDAAFMRLPDELFNRVGRSRIEACRRFVEEQHPGRAGQRTGDREPLLLTPGQDARRPLRLIAQPRTFDRLRFPGRAFRSADPAHRQCEAKVGENRPPQHDRVLKHHRLPAAALAVERPSLPEHFARGRPDQAVQQPQKQALAGAVGPHDHRATPGPDAGVDAIDEPLAAGVETQAARLEKRRRRSFRPCCRPHRAQVERRLTHGPRADRCLTHGPTALPRP